MTDNQFRLTRQQFLVATGLGGAVVGIAACGGNGQQSADGGGDTGGAKPDASGGTADPITSTADVPVGSGVIIGDIVVTQPNAGEFEAFSAVCTHKGCALADVSNGTINCPCHGSKFNLDGTVADGPASQPLERKPITVNGDAIVLSGP